MNRKKAQKEKRELETNIMAQESLAIDRKKAEKKSPLDNFSDWIGQRWETAPLTAQQVADFQRKLDSAFGAENAIILAWSGDERYWDEFYEDWKRVGNVDFPKGKLRKKPIALWAELPVNDYDVFCIFPPRFLLVERLDRSQYEEGWEAASWIEVEGIKRRIRSETPPESMYKVLRTIAEHEQTQLIGEYPPCCRYWNEGFQRICYGKYRPPSDLDLAYVRGIRDNMDRDGVAQRNDTERSKQLIENAAQSTRHYMKTAAMARTRSVNEMILADPMAYVGDVYKNKGMTLSQKEVREAVEVGLTLAAEEREKEFSQRTGI